MDKITATVFLAFIVFISANLQAAAQTGDLFTDHGMGQPITSLPSRAASSPLFSAPPPPVASDKDLLHPPHIVPNTLPQDMVAPTLHHDPQDKLYNWSQGSP